MTIALNRSEGLALKQAGQQKLSVERAKSMRALSRGNTTHGMAGTPTHTTWRKMRERCGNPNCDKWQWYGGRGIKVCDRWNESFEAFLADMGLRPEGMTLDREDSNGDYEPGNCRWATKAIQARNVSNIKIVEYRGVLIPLLELCEQLDCDIWRVRNRLRAGMPIEEAMTLPKGARVAHVVGATNGSSKLTAEQVVYIRTCDKSDFELAQELGLSVGGVVKARLAQTHAHIPAPRRLIRRSYR